MWVWRIVLFSDLLINDMRCYNSDATTPSDCLTNVLISPMALEPRRNFIVIQRSFLFGKIPKGRKLLGYLDIDMRIACWYNRS